MTRPDQYTRQKEALEEMESLHAWFFGEIIPEATKRLMRLSALVEVQSKQVRGTGRLPPVRTGASKSPPGKAGQERGLG